MARSLRSFRESGAGRPTSLGRRGPTLDRTTKERPLDVWLTALLDGIAGLGAWRFAIAGLGIFAETSLFVGLLIPGDTVVLVASSANRGPLEWLLMFGAVVLGSLGGESVGFLIGRWFGPRLRVSALGRRIGERHVLRAERWIDRRGGVAIFASRFLPVMHALVPVTVGASTYPYGRFLAWTAPACVLWAALYVSVGSVAGSSYRTLVQEFHFAGWIVLGGVAAFLLAAVLGKRLLHRFEHR